MTLRDAESRDEVPAGVPGARERGTVGTRRRARRTRSPHPGVVLVRPDAEHPYWPARYVDPDTGRTIKARFDPLALSTAEARRDWAMRKARTIAKRRMELESGAPKATGTALATAVGRYYEAHKQLRPKTLAQYKAASDKLLAWAARHDVHSADDLTRAKLLGFREEVLNAPKRRSAKRATRGTNRETRERRAPASVNRELRGVRVVLGYLAELDLLPKIHEGDLRRALKRLALTVEAPTFLRPAEIAALLEAALAHDAEAFSETRAEHAGEGERGKTERYDPIAPFVATLLLTGMRLGVSSLSPKSLPSQICSPPTGRSTLSSRSAPSYCACSESRRRSPSTTTGHARLRLAAGHARGLPLRCHLTSSKLCAASSLKSSTRRSRASPRGEGQAPRRVTDARRGRGRLSRVAGDGAALGMGMAPHRVQARSVAAREGIGITRIRRIERDDKKAGGEFSCEARVLN